MVRRSTLPKQHTGVLYSFGLPGEDENTSWICPRCSAPVSSATAAYSNASAPSPTRASPNTSARPSPCPPPILTLHTFGEYLDFHPHLHALVTDGLFTRDGTFHLLPDLPLKPLEELFRAHFFKLLVTLKLLPPVGVQVLLSWKHSGFNVHCGDPVPSEHKTELEKLAL